MQYRYTTLALSFLAMTGALARPYSASDMDTTITVSLSNGVDASSDLIFPSLPYTATPGHTGPFTQIALTVGKDVTPQDLRCQALDSNGKPIVELRGANTDVSFSDAGKGAWTFRAPTSVSSVTCDPAFTKIDPEDPRLNLRVVLSSDATETTGQTQVKAGIYQETTPVGSGGPFETVELRVGEFVAKQDQRCQVLDAQGNPATVHRGGKTDITFSDAGKGAWMFDQDTEISEIICDPNFVGASA